MPDLTVYVDSNNRNQALYPNSNSYTLHLTNPILNITKVELLTAMLPNIYSSQYLTLDIAELRTPDNLVADRLANVTIAGGTSNLMAPSGNAFYGSFATIPVKASGGALALAISNTISTVANSIAVNTEFYNANYRIWQDYPSRIDKLDRVTVTWRQPNNGAVFVDNNFNPPIDMGRNMFILRFETKHVPMEPERPLALPDPVQWDSGETRRLVIIGAVALGGLLIIMSMRRRQVELNSR
jgi:hypothetical protein